MAAPIEGHLRGAIPVLRLQLVAYVTIGRQRRPFEFLAFIRPRGNAGVKTETGHFTHRVTELILRIASRQRSESEYLTACLWPDRHTVSDRMPQRLSHRVFIDRIPGEITVFSTPEE
jgi:hypothetical protein